MAAPPPPPPPKTAFSLYDNLLDPNDPPASTTISSAPVIYNQSGAGEAKKPLDAALRFQPIRRPPVKHAKTKATFPKAVSAPKSPRPAEPSASTAIAVPAPTPPPVKSSLADWTATEDDEWRYGVGEKRQRGGRRRKKKQQQDEATETDWNELYDPARPTNVDEYLKSDEKIDEVREWKALLYRHRKRAESDISSDDEDEERRATTSNQFAPPPSYAFGPPPHQSPPAAAAAVAAPPLPQESADDAYARRMALSNPQQSTPIPSPPSQTPLPLPPPPPTTTTTSDSATISRAPVRYAQTSTSRSREEEENDDDDASSPSPRFDDGSGHREDDEEAGTQPRSSRPGQAGFAQRLMGKYGWTKGSGLGADESGIVNPLRVQVEKRRKKADADGGGWAEPGSKGKIIGSKRKQEDSKFGTMSDVIVLQNMLENMPDLQAEIADGLGQEIGEECGEKYGRVERLYIDHHSRRVFIKFTNQVSALRAVNELDGRVFNGNTIVPKFYDSDRFEGGIYSSA